MKMLKAVVVGAVVALSSVPAMASVIYTDSFGIKWDLSSDGNNYGVSDALYKLNVTADTTGFTTGSFNYMNSYINALTVQAEMNVLSGATSGPGGSWTNVVGGQDQGGCNGTAANSGFDCAYFTTGGNPVAGPGVLMSTNGGSLSWVFDLHFASGTTIDQALSFAADGSHLKADYYGYKNTQVCQGKGQNRICNDVPEYSFIGQLSNAVTINHKLPPECDVNCQQDLPEPAPLALMGIGLVGLMVARRRVAS